jgi:hypothetical protein
MVNNKYFQYLVGLSALLIAGSAAFFSVFGLSKLFAGATLAVIIMAGSLEFGKLVGASFLYRYWNSIANWLKVYMTVGVVTLVVITSAGIFGFLSNAYQGATIEFEKQSTTLIYKEDRLEQLEEDKVYLKEELEQAISELPENYRTAKRLLREDYNPKVIVLNDQILGIKQEVGDLKVALVETGVDVGPAIYLARAFETDIDTVVKFFIFILIFVFDPMAVSLVIAFNVVVRTENAKNTPIDKQINRYKRRMIQDKPEKMTIAKPRLTTVNPENKKPIEDKKVEVIPVIGRGGKAGK